MWLIGLGCILQTYVQNSRNLLFFKTFFELARFSIVFHPFAHQSRQPHAMPLPALPKPKRPVRKLPAPAPSTANLPCVLLTGFEAFGDDPSGQGLNPSALAVGALHGKRIAGHRVVASVLPCVFGQSITTLKALVLAHRPVLVVCVGQAGGRAGISIERIAVNLDDAPLPDNAGRMLHNTPVVAGGPAAYFSTLPVQAMLAALQRAGAPCELSSSAGHFVCNHVFYALMHLLAKKKSAVRGGFVHVPYLPEQAADICAPSMALDEMTRGLSVAVRAALVK
jgi:pyroglutamyl-peptidase